MRMVFLTFGFLAAAIVAGITSLALRSTSLPPPPQPTPPPTAATAPAPVPATIAAATAPAATRPAIFTLRATYSHEMGPHINMPNGARATPLIDRFTITGSSDPRLVGVSLSVRFGSPKSAAYPKNLTPSQEVHLRLTPSAETLQQVEANLAKGFKFAWVNANELETDDHQDPSRDR